MTIRMATRYAWRNCVSWSFCANDLPAELHNEPQATIHSFSGAFERPRSTPRGRSSMQNRPPKTLQNRLWCTKYDVWACYVWVGVETFFIAIVWDKFNIFLFVTNRLCDKYWKKKVTLFIIFLCIQMEVRLFF